MAKKHAYLAVDLGAESGRVIKGTLSEGKLELEQINRFPNGMVPIAGNYCWNLVRLYESMIEAFKQCADSQTPIESIGVDSWGVDFMLLAKDKTPLGFPVAYRDSRTDGMMEKLFETIPAEKIYEKTGIAFLKFNTIYQLLALSSSDSTALKEARHLLMTPDFFHYLFTGKMTNEYTIASTSQGVNLETRKWDSEILQAVGASPELLNELIEPGTVIGPLTKQIQEITGLGPIPVVAPGGHDTASAVAAVPANSKNWAYISSGTWSLMGIETDKPMPTRKAFEYNFTNEGGVLKTIRFLKNIMGLWLVQRCRADFGSEFDYGQLTEMAANAPAFKCLINPDLDEFMNPVSMTKAIDKFCERTGQPKPQSKGEYIRCSLDSLALQYRLVIQQLVEIYAIDFEKIHIVGGGIQNKVLNQFTADATGLTVEAGPVEATVAGNIMMQAIGLGHIESLAKGRKIIRDSFPVETYQPKDTETWHKPFERFLELKKA